MTHHKHKLQLVDPKTIEDVLVFQGYVGIGGLGDCRMYRNKEGTKGFLFRDYNGAYDFVSAYPLVLTH